MAISTYKTFLMVKKISDWEKLLDITQFPSLGGEPEQIDVTTLSDSMKKFIKGVQNIEKMEFEALYGKTIYAELLTLSQSEHEYAIWFGGTGEGDTLIPTGDNGKFKFKAELSVFVTGGGVNDPVKIKLTLLPTTMITFE